GALRAGDRRALPCIVLGDAGAPVGMVHREIAQELRVAIAAALGEIHLSATRGLRRQSPGAGDARDVAPARGGKRRHREGGCEEDPAGEEERRGQARVRRHGAASEDWARTPTWARPARIRHTFHAKHRWLATIRRPPTVRHSQNGSAATTESRNGFPPTHAKPCRIPATEIATM